jgi:hypothetical protein
MWQQMQGIGAQQGNYESKCCEPCIIHMIYLLPYPISERKPDFLLILFPPWGTSLIFCRELLIRLSEVLLPGT